MTNEEFQKLLHLKKKFLKDSIKLPNNGEECTFDLESQTTNDKFYLDIDRKGKIELSKFKIQNRYALTKLPLIRIDINSPPHINPDGRKTSRNHIHIYKETDNDTGNLPWAYDLESFQDCHFNLQTLNFMQVFLNFCKYCHIEVDNIQGVI